MAQLPGYECARKRKLLDAFVDQELSNAEHQDITEHLRNCAACREEVEGIRFLVKSLQQLPQPLLSEDFLSRDISGNISKPPMLCSRHKVVPRHSYSDNISVLTIRIWGCSAAALVLFIGGLGELRFAGEMVHILTAPITITGLISRVYSVSHQKTCDLSISKPYQQPYYTVGSNYKLAEAQISVLEAAPTLSEQSSSITNSMGLESGEDGLYAIKM